MAIDFRSLKISTLVQLLNSTPAGEVTSERMLIKHRSRAGLRIGDGKTINLVRYAAWLVLERHKPMPADRGSGGYEALKEQSRQRNIALSLAGRDIAPLPKVVNPERKDRAERDYRSARTPPSI